MADLKEIGETLKVSSPVETDNEQNLENDPVDSQEIPPNAENIETETASHVKSVENHDKSVNNFDNNQEITQHIDGAKKENTDIDEENDNEEKPISFNDESSGDRRNEEGIEEKVEECGLSENINTEEAETDSESVLINKKLLQVNENLNLNTLTESENSSINVETRVVFSKDLGNIEPEEDQIIPSENPKIEPNSPFALETLIEKVDLYNPEIPESEDSYITCISAYENNMYIGTQHGEILHFYKLDKESQYIIISRQRAHSSKVKPINKILLLPQVSKALVLNGSIINIFSLPEFSPANIGKIKDVNDLTVDTDNSQNDDSSGVQVVLFTKKMIRIINVTQESLKLVKDISYPHTIKGLQRSKFALVATKTNYDLIDVNSFQKIPLLPVSTTGQAPQNLTPFIFPISKHEYLITCGSSKTDPAMGMVVNNSGDISRGTIPWLSYPESIAIDYPYTLAVLKNDDSEGYHYELSVHSINDQKDVQKMRFVEDEVLTTVKKEFEDFYEPLMKVVIRVNILTKEIIISDRLKEFCKIKTSVVLYQPKGNSVNILKCIPRLCQLQQVIETRNKTALQKEYDDFIKQYDDENINVLLEDQITLSFLKEGLALMFIVDEDFSYGQSFWCNQYDNLSLNVLEKLSMRKVLDKDSELIKSLKLRLDPKIIVYLFNNLLQKSEIIDSYFRFSSITIYKPFENFMDLIMEQKSENHQRMYLKILTDWLNKFQGIIETNSSTELNFSKMTSPKGLSNKTSRRKSFDVNPENVGSKSVRKAASIIYQNKKASHSDTNLQESKSPVIPEENVTKPNVTGLDIDIIVNKLDLGNLLQDVGDELVDDFKMIEMILLKFHILDSFKKKTDKNLLLFVNKFIKLMISETIECLKTYKKFSVILQIYESLNKYQEYLELWMSLMNQDVVDEISFPINDNPIFYNYEISKMNSRILNDQIYNIDPVRYFEFLININEQSSILDEIFNPKSVNKISELQVLKLFHEKFNDENVKNWSNKSFKFESVSELKRGYIEFLISEDKSKKKNLLGTLIFQNVYFLTDIAKNNYSLAKAFMEKTIINYKKVAEDEKKVSIDQFFKVQLKLTSQNEVDENGISYREIMTFVYDTHKKLISLLRSMTEYEKIMLIDIEHTNEKGNFEMTKFSKRELVENIYSLLEKYQDIFTVDLIFFDGYLNRYERTVDQLIQLGDFKSAEEYIGSSGIMLFGKKLNNNVNEIKFPKTQLLIKVYNNYLKNHLENQNLIEDFLKSYSTQLDYNILLNNIPENNHFSMKYVSDTILMRNLIILNDKYNLSVMKKNLARSELAFYNKVFKQLESYNS